jgi:hypothetical protein
LTFLATIVAACKRPWSDYTTHTFQFARNDRPAGVGRLTQRQRFLKVGARASEVTRHLGD